ncbi:MAG: hypothetical protein IIA14_15370, partial [SAR324 cluster bacterium]|nr:hypothetical protein [SAR324 cluster bacterium]
MSDVVFVLGAGASKEGGAPLMAEFLDVADHLWRSNSVKEKNQHFENVFKGRGALQAIHSKSQLDFNNIESVFATFEMAKILEKMPGHSLTQINDLIISLKELIVETLQSTLVFPVKRDHVVSPNPYDSFCDLLEFLATETTPNLKVSIITFNYDLAIDYALYRNRVVPNYGLIE